MPALYQTADYRLIVVDCCNSHLYECHQQIHEDHYANAVEHDRSVSAPKKQPHKGTHDQQQSQVAHPENSLDVIPGEQGEGVIAQEDYRYKKYVYHDLVFAYPPFKQSIP
ncbi:hypothetical protein TspCOW1_21150 [Thiohalobacter sp. COW1]|nr:hypothetical protein TspCOW1_21150 [Thiohalobacter sp. COW1]